MGKLIKLKDLIRKKIRLAASRHILNEKSMRCNVSYAFFMVFTSVWSQRKIFFIISFSSFSKWASVSSILNPDFEKIIPFLFWRSGISLILSNSAFTAASCLNFTCLLMHFLMYLLFKLFEKSLSLINIVTHLHGKQALFCFRICIIIYSKR